MTDFIGFPKIARFSRDIIITEKIDGTNACIKIDDGVFLAGSRTRWITPEDDNAGFARWAYEHQEELTKLGHGLHFGEWWGQGIKRNYGLKEKRFSLFNVSRWCLFGREPQRIPCGDPRIEKYQEVLPECCGLVPVLYRGEFDTLEIEDRLDDLAQFGSFAAPDFMNPEGIVIFHTAGNIMFKKTILKDDQPKGKVKS